MHILNYKFEILNKFKYQIIKISILFSVSLFGFSIYALPVIAQSPTAADIRNAVQQQVAQELSNIKQAVAKKGFVGNITAKTDASITLTNLKSQPRSVVITGDTTIKLANGSEGTLADLKINDFILVMGSVDSQNKMTAARLLVIKQPAADKRDTKYGIVSKPTSSSLTLGDLTVKLSSTTTVTDAKLAKAKISDIKDGAKVVVVGSVTGTTLTATDVHLMP